MNAAQIAREAVNQFGSACQDIAFGKPWEESWNKEAAAWLKQAKKDGVRDLQGAYADVLFCDPDVALDFLGDSLCAKCGDDDALHDQAVEELRDCLRGMPTKLFVELRRTPLDA